MTVGTTSLTKPQPKLNGRGHMLSGKAIARAIRGHFIVDAVLTSFLLERGLQNYNTQMQTGSLDQIPK